ncbi:hypothetical protein DPMN_055040 [Dreissena polymorpha]|uniref:Uncharacterized protein n=1 Tax=Dreissena polymorpha TaxID=45954 RepID=A0A9D4CQ12_DREPO|nr:hypothetical protein DPMN_055040 [Dreissena polymorpha]
MGISVDCSMRSDLKGEVTILPGVNLNLFVESGSDFVNADRAMAIIEIMQRTSTVAM